MTDSVDLSHKIQENLDLLHKIQVVKRHGGLTSKTEFRRTAQDNIT